MAGASLLALLDDITALLDDIALMTKTAASKTAGVLGDDLAVNAEQASGVKADRELPVVWAVAKGSLVNKAIIVPIALLFSAFLPWVILPILMCGGLYLCFEGAEKVFASHHANKQKEQSPQATLSANELVAFEKNKIKGAIRTDFVLSIEIIVITLGTVATAPLVNQFAVLTLIAFLATIGVYGIVALIVKLDDAGLWLFQQGQSKQNKLIKKIGLLLVNSAPYLMKLLTVVGTIAMFLVGGGILAHSIHIIGEYFNEASLWVTDSVVSITWLANFVEVFMPILLNGLLGFMAGSLLFLVVPKMQQLFTSSSS